MVPESTAPSMALGSWKVLGAQTARLLDRVEPNVLDIASAIAWCAFFLQKIASGESDFGPRA